MVQNNKVLTVSYGTFSCTLEGFDDSFETMKAIAEYFRDLAAEDRYFGSEPPQPDTEMLTRIAQRDASRRVEASQDDSGLLIRATEAAATPPQPAASASDMSVIETPPSPTAAQSFFEEAEPVVDESGPAADSIAAKLQRIRAVVSHSEENSVIYTEDEDTTLMKNAGPSDAVAAAFAAGSLDPADLNEPEEPDLRDETAPEAEPEAELSAEVEVAEVSELQSELEEPEAKPEPEVSDEAPEDTEVEDTAPTETWFADIEEDEEETNILSDIAAEDEVATDAEEGIFTEEDENDLLEEISSVETILANRAVSVDEEQLGLDQDVSRLMDKASEQLKDPNTSNQREAYTHLRAAVAATEAERGEKGIESKGVDEDGYRGDLSSVVSPRRPEVEVTSVRPSSDDSAPLKLVAEQRVDNRTEDAGPISPRRVMTTSEDEAPEDEGGFAQFAQEQGAQSLSDLLEAAAAYLSFIEGQEQFSRPQLMNKIRSLKQDDFNREESLRSFGQLLRDGKIEKAGGGRFSASTQIGFRPDDERAAG